MKTAEGLLQAYEEDTSFTPTLSVPIIKDFFGWRNLPGPIRASRERLRARIDLLTGVYRGLYSMDITAYELEHHRLTNTLDELIHRKYKQYPTASYYVRFCEEHIPIGPTYVKQNKLGRLQ